MSIFSYKMDGAVIWITGLSGSGKSTIACKVSVELNKHNIPHVLLDGDRMREILPWQSGHSREERLRLGMFYSNLCRELSRQGLVVVCSTISLFHDVHKRNREVLKSYFEVLLDVPLTELRRRNAKGLYRGDDGPSRDVVGCDIVPEFPMQPDLVIKNYGNTSPKMACDLILRSFPIKRSADEGKPAS